ncbi:MAG: hypothetical protein HGB28_02150, partial [Oscillochloris sp.]|nr:hypothetical protein [Oscillochloris sp.]
MDQLTSSHDEIILAAKKAGLHLTEVETALLHELVDKGEFHGIQYLQGTGGVAIPAEPHNWLPTVWNGNDIEPESGETDIQKHATLYAQVPFPVVSSDLLRWLFSAAGSQYAHRIYLTTIRVAGDLYAQECQSTTSIGLTDCVFEKHFLISGHFTRVDLTNILALSFTVSGECIDGIYMNDVQCRFIAGRIMKGIYLHDFRSNFVDIYGLYSANSYSFGSGGIAMYECNIDSVAIRGRGLSCGISMRSCAFKDLSINQLLTNASVDLSHVKISHEFRLYLDPGARDVCLNLDHVDAYKYIDLAENIKAIKKLNIEGLTYQELVEWQPN